LQIEQTHLFSEAANPAGARAPRLTFQAATRQFQAKLIQQALKDTGWNISEVARELDLARSHIYNLIRALGLRRE
jgi:Nif-specific regulatory protein